VFILTPKNNSILPLLGAVIILLCLTMYNLHLVKQLDLRHPCEICKAEGHSVFYVEGVGFENEFIRENERNLYQEGTPPILLQDLPTL